MSGFVFGAPPASAQPQSGAFGAAPAASTSFFGTGGNAATSAPLTFPAGGMAGGVSSMGASGQAAPTASFSTHPFQYIQQCLDPASPNYRFRYFFYNAVPGGMVSNAQTRPPFVSDRLWTQVIDDNPDPTKMVPVLANGFGDLSARRNWQNEHQQAQRSKLAELEQRLSSLLTRQDLDVSTQVQVIQRQQLKLTLRVLQLMRKVEVMRRTGQRLAGNEQALLGKLQDLQSQLLRPSSSTHPNATRQMETQLQTLLESGRLDPLSSLRQTVVSDDTAQATLQSILSQQQGGLKAVVEVINKTAKDLETMRHGFIL